MGVSTSRPAGTARVRAARRNGNGIADVLRRWSAQRPAHNAFVYRHEGQRFARTYRQLDDASNRVAQVLLSFGVTTGEIVAVAGHNLAQTPEVYFGVLKAGAVLFPINFRYTHREIESALTAAQPRLAICERGTGAIDVCAKRGVRIVLTMPSRGERVAELWDAALEAVEAHDPHIPVDEDSAHIVLFTSGTTGASKGVVQRHRDYLVQTALPVFGEVGTGENDIVLCMYPLFHSSGWRTSLIAWQAGATAVILGSGATGEVADAVDAEGVTQLMALPQTLRELLSRQRDGEPRAVSVRHLNTGTEGVGADELRQWAAMFGLQGVRVHYGSSEIGPATVLSAADSVDAATSVGRPWEGVSIRIVDPETGDDLPVGTRGEVQLRTPWMMAGYFNAPELTEGAFEGGREAGWYRTGDLGCVDDEGRLFIVGRVNDAIRSGGEWVYPGEVEALLAGIRGVRTAAIVGVPHPRWGQRPVAFVEREPGAELDLDVISARCREGLAAYKCPDWVEIVDELPRVGATDKIDRGRLRSHAQRREALATGSASRVEESERR